MTLPVIHQDEDLIVVNKPSGLLVHRSSIASEAREFALQIVRDQIGKTVYPVHRLDRATSGALVFALSSDMARALTQKFADGEVEKTYLAIVRGIAPEHALIDYALKEELDRKADPRTRTDKPAQPARTGIRRLATHEFQVMVDKFPTSRYSLVEARPETGRKHQIRRHLRHIGCPIIGDVTHGSGKHNRFFAETFGHRRLYLACTSLAFRHPRTDRELLVEAPLAPDFRDVIARIGWATHV